MPRALTTRWPWRRRPLGHLPAHAVGPLLRAQLHQRPRGRPHLQAAAGGRLGRGQRRLAPCTTSSWGSSALPSAADLPTRTPPPLQVTPDGRLGSGPLGAAEIKAHRWFSRIDWAALEQRSIPAPIRPRVRSPLDTSNFDIFDNVEEAPAPPKTGSHPDWEQWDWVQE
jgi:hypothetical protein